MKLLIVTGITLANLIALASMAVILTAPAAAGGIVVNTTEDAVDADLKDEVCDIDLGTDGLQCSLRAAVQQANADDGAEVIELAAETYTLTIKGSEGSGAAGDLNIDDDLAIIGVSGSAVIQAGEKFGTGIDRVLQIDKAVSVELNGVTIRHGVRASAPGGGILNSGALTMVNSSVVGNLALNGGGIYNDGGSLEISGGVIEENEADTEGGGIFNDAGPASIDAVQITGNSAGDNGGGIFNQGAELDVMNGVLGENFAGIDGGGMYNGGGQVTIDDVNVVDNAAGANGGGLNSEEKGATLLVMNSIVSGNSATQYNGGGIDAEFFSTSVTVISTTVSENSAGSNGGGIYVFQDTDMTIEDTTIDGNTSTFNGAGLYYGGTGQATVMNSTISGNMASGFGGGVFSDRVATLTNVTISGNASNGNGGGIWVRANTTIVNGTITANTADADDDGSGDGGGVFWTDQGGNAFLRNTIVAGNFDPTSDPDCYGRLTSQGYNLIQTVSANCEVVGDTATNITGEDPLLGVLADNGGPTDTHALTAGSPAIDAVKAGCPPPTEDQRGVERPLGPLCDIGAYEAPKRIQGDVDCDGDVDTVDALFVLRHVAALPVNLPKGCPEIGTDGPPASGNVDCDGDVDTVDALFILRHVAALPVNVPKGCAPIGSPA